MAEDPKQTTKRLSIDKIIVDRTVQPRVVTDNAVVKDYAERIEAGDDFPLIEVFSDGEKNWLSVGFHRLAAYKKAGRKQINCIVHEGGKADAQWYAIQSNKDIGLRRNTEDKKRAVLMAFEHPNGKDMSDRGIADLVGVSPTMVAKYRPKPEPTANGGQSTKRKGRDGRTTNTAKIGKTPKAKSSAKPEVKAGNKTAAPKAGHDGRNATGLVEDTQTEDLVTLYRRMLETLPDTLDKLGKHAPEIAGKAMSPKAAMEAIVLIYAGLDDLHDAEKNGVKAC